MAKRISTKVKSQRKIAKPKSAVKKSRISKSTELESKYHLLAVAADNFPNGSISVISKDLKFIFSAGSGFKNFDIDPSTYIGKSLESVLEPKVYHAIKRFLPKLLNGHIISHKVFFKGKHFLNSYKPISNGKGKIDSFVLTSQDISEVEVIRLENEKLSQVVQKSLNEVYIFNSKSLKFEYANEGALRNLGYTIEDMFGMTPVDIKPEYTKASFNLLVEGLRSGKQDKIIFETIHKRANATTYPVEVHLQIMKSGREKVFVAIILDITTRSQIVQELNQTNQELFNSIEELRTSENEAASALEELMATEAELRNQNMELLQSQNALTENKEILSNIANSIPGLIMRYLVKPDGTDQILFVTKGAEELWEVPYEQILRDANNLWSKIHPNDLPQFYHTIKESATNLTRWQYQYRAIMNDGRVKWISAVGAPKKLEDGSVLWNSVALDVTQLSMAKVQLKESELKYSSLVENATVGIVVHKPDTSIILANPKASSILELSQEQLFGLKAIDPYWRFLTADGETLPLEEYPVNRVLRTKEILHDFIIGIVYDNSKKPKWGICNGTPIFDSHGNIEQVIIIFSDITNRIQAEVALANATRLLQETNEIAGLGRWEVFFNTDIVELSDITRQIFGLPEDYTMTLKMAIDFFEAGESRSTIENLIERAINAGENYMNDLQVRTLNGVLRWVRTYGKTEFKNGKCTRFYGAIQDITDRKVIEAELKRVVDELEQLVKEKENLFKELHHRIKNSLQMVASVLSLKSGVTSENELGDFIKDTKSRIQSIASVHEQLLQEKSIQNLDAGKYLEDLVKTLVASHTDRQSKYPTKLRFESHVLHLDQVLNLGFIANEVISNIIKYAYPLDAGGPIRASLSKSDDEYVLFIADDGVGITKENLEAESASLGLQLIRLFTQQLNGSLQVNAGRGTSFTIKFK